MGRLLASGDAFTNAAAPATAAPLTVAGWFKPTDTTSAGTFISLDNGALTHRFVTIKSAAAKAQITATAGGANSSVSTTTSYSAGAWQNASGIVVSATDRRVYLSAAGLGQDSVSRIPTGINAVRLGKVSDGTLPYVGALAEWAVWNVALSSAEVARLNEGHSPFSVRPANLVAYWPLLGTTSPEPDRVGSFPLTLVGTPANANDHPTMLPPLSGTIAAAGTASAALAAVGALSGAVAASSTASAALAGSAALSGAAAAAATAAASLAASAALVASTDAASTAAAALAATGALAGSADAAGAMAATLTGAGVLSGSSSAAAAASAAAVGEGALSANIAALAALAGGMQGAGVLAGSTAAQAALAGLLAGSVPLGGAIIAALQISGALLGVAGLSTHIDALASLAGVLSGSGTPVPEVRYGQLPVSRMSPSLLSRNRTSTTGASRSFTRPDGVRR